MNEESDILLGIKGKMIEGFFGFCDIRQFTIMSKVLDEQIINFVNVIAEIVHGTADQYSGEANRNIGDAFLIVWPFPKTKRYEGLSEDEVKEKYKQE
jgi:class 3 adenylate cyclase